MSIKMMAVKKRSDELRWVHFSNLGMTYVKKVAENSQTLSRPCECLACNSISR
jgi:hypothetical protein